MALRFASRKPVYGFGINDADYQVRCAGEDGKLVTCPYYERWHSMLRRCYGEKELARNPSYRGASVCTEWLTFSNFKAWMEKQDWEGKHLDKDLLCKGNRVYCSQFCVFVSKLTNTFILDSLRQRGKYMLGVSWHKRDEIFTAQCNNTFAENRFHKRFLGYFETELEAHLAWKAKKHEYACILADLQEDSRVAAALREMFK